MNTDPWPSTANLASRSSGSHQYSRHGQNYGQTSRNSKFNEYSQRPSARKRYPSNEAFATTNFGPSPAITKTATRAPDSSYSGLLGTTSRNCCPSSPYNIPRRDSCHEHSRLPYLYCGSNIKKDNPNVITCENFNSSLIASPRNVDCLAERPFLDPMPKFSTAQGNSCYQTDIEFKNDRSFSTSSRVLAFTDPDSQSSFSGRPYSAPSFKQSQLNSSKENKGVLNAIRRETAISPRHPFVIPNTKVRNNSELPFEKSSIISTSEESVVPSEQSASPHRVSPKKAEESPTIPSKRDNLEMSESSSVFSASSSSESNTSEDEIVKRT